jgi:hypothetical protein
VQADVRSLQGEWSTTSAITKFTGVDNLIQSLVCWHISTSYCVAPIGVQVHLDLSRKYHGARRGGGPGHRVALFKKGCRQVSKV